MRKRVRALIFVSSLIASLSGWSPGQESAKTSGAEASAVSTAAAEHGVDLATRGRCNEALAVLNKSARKVTNKDLRYNVEMSIARCAMSLNQTDTAVRALLDLNRDFPHDPEVLFTTTHVFSDLASRASQQLAATAPTSPQAEQLEAEAFESQEDWDKAMAEYKKILEQNPRRHGIHYRMGRMFLTRTPPDADSARREFEEELKVDPNNAAAEFLLGETARQAGQWDDAITHFSQALKLDQGFEEAYLALGMSLNAAGKFADSIAPLKIYVKMQPGDPAGHYQLATAYARTGHKPEAEREMALQRETAAKTPRAQ